MYAYYVATHEKINPWTSNYEAFCKKLPETAYYAESVSEIIACAFVEGNEIVYICSRDREHFKEFARCLVTFILSQYKNRMF